MPCLGSTYTVMDQNHRRSGSVCQSSYMRANYLAVLANDIVELIRVGGGGKAGGA